MFRRILELAINDITLRHCTIANKSRSTRPKLFFNTLTMAKSNTGGSTIKPQNYNYFLVLDFEATCSKGRYIKPQEIIEFPVLKVSGVTFETESTFHQYVEPQVHKELSPFCTELTGIIQEMVDGQPNITETLQKLDVWMKNEGLLEPGVRSVFVTCGDWDLKTMLPNQSAYFGFTYAEYLKHWINIKKPFCESLGFYPKGMMPMLSQLKVEHEGRHHSGIDDSKNIAQILKQIALRGYVFKETGSL
ncbi:hypothetical protein LSH36_187g06027 [Paralvinella palmiformis]|uniref:Exonuclease domain-containing protein n=1 Tax=Paralvinella palmiformis TaxID=53620 RepID=A0AAD9JQS9_9ANNE|nr:hypothetical protein LSH36_187g06027 [Paralvinella palmiformis]